MQPNRADGSPGRCRQHGGLYAAAGSGLLIGGALGYVGLVDPHNTNSIYPLCPFKLLTGWNCPFCGGLRMAHDLLHGLDGATQSAWLSVGSECANRVAGRVSRPFCAACASTVLGDPISWRLTVLSPSSHPYGQQRDYAGAS
jgi:hypothetical protein